MSGWRNPRGHAGVGRAVTYLLFTLCCQAGVLEVDCHSQLKTRPVSCAGEAAAGAGVFIWVSCYKSALSRHMSRGVTRCSSVATQFTQTALQCLKCDLALGTSPLPLDTGVRIVSEGGHYCHYGQLNHLTWCRVTYWWCSSWLGPTPSSQLGPAQCFLLCSFIGVLLSSPPLIPGLDVSQLFPTMHSSISAANRQAAANINKLRIKLKILSLSSNLRA